MIRRIFLTSALIASTGCASLLGLDDFTEGEGGGSATGTQAGPTTGTTNPDASSSTTTATTTPTGTGGDNPTAQGPGGGSEGGGGSGPGPLGVEPYEDVTVGILRSQQFTSDVEGTTWEVLEDDAGTIDENGLYIAPDEPTGATIRATNGDVTVDVPIVIVPLGVEIVAGKPGGPGHIDGPPSRSRIARVEGIAAIDGGEKMIFSDVESQTIRVIDTQNNVVSTVGGLPFTPGLTNGSGDDARFDRPTQIAADKDGNSAFIVDQDNYCIRRINIANDTVTTVAGECGERGNADAATGADARFDTITSMALNDSGQRLYLCQYDGANNQLRIVTVSTGATTTVPAADIPIGYDCKLSMPGNNNRMYVVSGADNIIRSFSDSVPFDPDSVQEVVTLPSQLSYPDAFAVNEYNDYAIYVARDQTLYRYRFNAPGDGFLVWFGDDDEEEDPYVDGLLEDARTPGIREMAIDFNRGRLYLVDEFATLRRMDVYDDDDAAVETVAGAIANREPIDGPASAARFPYPFTVALDQDGNMYTGSFGGFDNTLRKVDAATGEASTFSGVRVQDDDPVPVDGDAETAVFGGIIDIVQIGDFLYVCDLLGHAIRRVSIEDGSVTTLVGDLGVPGFDDGFGISAHFNFDEGGGIGTDGETLYVADGSNFAIRAVNVTTKEVTTIAGGTEGTADGTGEAAQFLGPVGVVATGDGTLYIADYKDARIRQLDLATGEVTTLTGQSEEFGNEDGAPSVATFSGPFRMTLDGIGNLYVTGLFGDFEDSTPSFIRRIDLATSVTSTLAGSPNARGLSATPLPATLGCALGTALDGNGDLIFADFCDGAIGAIRPL